MTGPRGDDAQPGGQEPGAPRSKDDRRDAARARAKAEREAAAKRRRRNRILLQAGIGVVVLAIVVIGALVITSLARTNSTASADGGTPAHTVAGGITIGAGGKVSPHRSTGTKAVPLVRTYEDFMCSSCGAFEKANATYLAGLVNSGKITLEITPISILDRLSAGTMYSTRSAAAAGCVAQYAPDRFFEFHRLLYANQPAEESSGLTNAQLAAYATQAGAKPSATIAACIDKQTYASAVTAITQSVEAALPNSGGAKLSGTPTIIINSKVFTGDFASQTAVAPAIAAASR